MPCFALEDLPKLPFVHCKSLPTLIRDACAHCHGTCLRRAASSWNSQDEDSDDDDYLDSNLDYKHVIILEIRSRAMKAKSGPKNLLFSGSLSWAVSPTTGRVVIAPKEKRDGGEDCDYDADDDESEAFFSVQSCFSHCSSKPGSELVKELRGRSILEDFGHCEGWPFGLCRRALILPPLPSTPSDSWMWHKRSLAAKNCT